MRAIGNFLWFLLGGIFMGLGWVVVGCIMYITVIGIPWGRSCFVIAKFNFLPFGKEAISRKELTGEDDLGTGTLGILGNVIWFLLAGLWLAIGHAICGVLNLCTVIGIPFGIQHLKLAGISLSPIGKTIVTAEVAEEARRRNASGAVDQARGETTP